MLLNTIERRKSKKIYVGTISIGGDAPIAVQSMTNTNTENADSTIVQIQQILAAGADLVRVSVPTKQSVESLKKIRQAINAPLIADIHFDHQLALGAVKAGMDCIRINPGNIGKKDYIQAVVSACKDKNIPIRIGINGGSLEKDIQTKYGEPNATALVESAMRQIDWLDQFDFDNFKISVKSSDVMISVQAYKLLAKQIIQPLHLGITEAGSLHAGTIKSSIGLGCLLAEGIGDTLRVSLAADPVEEVKVAFGILKSLHLRKRGVNLIACPSCSRQEFDVIGVVNALEARLEDITESIDVAIIGCVVNGPGEAKTAHIGLTGGQKRHLLYLDGQMVKRIGDENLVDYLEKTIREKL